MKERFYISKERKEELARLLMEVKACYGEPGDLQSNHKIIMKRCEEINEEGNLVPSEREHLYLSNDTEKYEVSGYFIPIAYKIKSDNIHCTVEGDISKGGAYERLILYMVVGQHNVEYIADHHFCLHHLNNDGGYYIYTVKHGYKVLRDNHEEIKNRWEEDAWVICDEKFREH